MRSSRVGSCVWSSASTSRSTRKAKRLSLDRCDLRGSLLHLSPREKVARETKENTEEKVKQGKGQPRQWSGDYSEVQLGVQRPG